MKKIITCIVSLSLVFMLAACSADGSGNLITTPFNALKNAFSSGSDNANDSTEDVPSVLNIENSENKERLKKIKKPDEYYDISVAELTKIFNENIKSLNKQHNADYPEVKKFKLDEDTYIASLHNHIGIGIKYKEDNPKRIDYVFLMSGADETGIGYYSFYSAVIMKTLNPGIGDEEINYIYDTTYAPDLSQDTDSKILICNNIGYMSQHLSKENNGIVGKGNGLLFMGMLQ